MGKGGWHDAPWKGILSLLRGDKTIKPPIGYLPDRGSQKQRNHRWLGAAWHLLWLRKYGASSADRDMLSLIWDWSDKALRQEKIEGLGVHAGAVEINMPDPHTSYDILPRLIFLLAEVEDNEENESVERLRQIWRWQLYAWKAGSTDDGQVVLPCTRVVTPLSQVADACNRMLNLDDNPQFQHRNNKWQARTWDQWWKMFKDDPTSTMWTAEYFRRALEEHGKESLFRLKSKPNLEPPLLAYPITIIRSTTGHGAIMYPNPLYGVIAPCYKVMVKYGRKNRATDNIQWSTDRSREERKSGRMGVEKV